MIFSKIDFMPVSHYDWRLHLRLRLLIRKRVDSYRLLLCMYEPWRINFFENWFYHNLSPSRLYNFCSNFF